MPDDHFPVKCANCGARPTLVRLGDRTSFEHGSFGVECDCLQSDGATPVGSFVDVNTLPAAWHAPDADD